MGKRVGSRRRGHGSSVYRSPSHRHLGSAKYPRNATKGVVEELLHSPGKTAPYAKVRLDDNSTTYLIAAEGMYEGQTIHFDGSVIDIGNVAKLRDIPEGTLVYNIEARPGDGGKYVRSGGSYAVVVSRGIKTIVQLPSGEFRPFNPECRATIGKSAGGGRKDKPIIKAGKKHHMMRSKSKNWPIVSGVAMNAANHPHGGGNHQHVGHPNTVSRNAPPGQKVGKFSPKKKDKKKRKA